jgi:GT2 family glycosyltransferase
VLPRVCIVTLNWNGLADTTECLRSLLLDPYPNKELVLIDNGSTDNSVAELQRQFPTVTFIENRPNLGFTGGNNVGLRHAIAGGADYVYWLNNDTTSDPAAIGKLIEAAIVDPRAGILTPVIHYFDHPRQPWFAGAHMDLSRGIAVHDNSNVPAPNDPVRSLPWISGCAMFADVKLMQSLGGFDERFFLYWEDVDLSLRVTRAGRALSLVPGARVYHRVSRTASARPGVSRYYYVRNNLLLVRLHRAAAGKWATTRVLLARLREGLRESRHARNLTSLRLTIRGIRDYLRGRFGPQVFD